MTAPEDPLAVLVMEWHDVMVERKAIRRPSSIRQCEEQDERSEGPCYGRGRLFYGPDNCDPCKERMARFNEIKGISARLRGIEARMFNHAARVAAARREEENRG